MGAQRRSRRGGMLVEKQEWFVRLIAQGVSNSEACRIVGITRRTGTRWRYGRTILNTAGEPVHYPPVRLTAPKPQQLPARDIPVVCTVEQRPHCGGPIHLARVAMGQHRVRQRRNMLAADPSEPDAVSDCVLGRIRVPTWCRGWPGQRCRVSWWPRRPRRRRGKQPPRPPPISFVDL